MITLSHPLRQQVLAALQAEHTFAITVPVLVEMLFGVGVLPRSEQNQAEWQRLRPKSECYIPDESDAKQAADLQIQLRRQGWQLAQDLRAVFARYGIFVANLVSSPGAGKTELLRRTMAELSQSFTPAAVTGDLATENDAGRLAESGALSKQILTGTRCHLEADMAALAMETIINATGDVFQEAARQLQEMGVIAK